MSEVIGKKNGRNKRRIPRGSALLTGLVGVMVLNMMVASYMSAIVSEKNMTERTWSSMVAMNVAEAGAELAIWEISYGGSDFDAADGWAGVNPKTLSGTLSTSGGMVLGDYSISVQDPATNNSVVTVAGDVPNQAASVAQRTVQIEVGPEYLFSMAAFGRNGIRMSSNARTDSFDSRIGDYGGGNVGSDGHVGTNSVLTSPAAIQLASNASVAGAAYIGPGGDVNAAITTGSNAEITGGKYAMLEEIEVVSIDPPSGLPLCGALTLNGNSTQTITTSGQYTSITLNSNSRLIISGDVEIYVTGNIALNSNSQIELTIGNEAQFYIDGGMTMNSNSRINNVGRDPTKLSIYGTDALTAGINFNSNSSLYGTIYAPNAPIAMSSNSVIYGSVFGSLVTLNSNARIHFDKALEQSGIIIGFSVFSWQEKN